ncbi:MAG: hypothetical protein ACYTFV_11515 [Planctomycetota bacterium]|jgi:hypothetical protein
MRLPVEQRAALATTLGPGDAPLFALLPSPFDGGRSTFVVEIAINDADESTIEALIGQLEQQVNAPLESPFATVDTVRRIELTTALASLEGDRRRAALSYLALGATSRSSPDRRWPPTWPWSPTTRSWRCWSSAPWTTCAV